MSNYTGLYDIRSYKDSDKNFILSTFLKGLYYGDSWFSVVDKRSFMDNYKGIANGLLTSKNVAINIACLPEDPDIILGYSIISKDQSTIHWVFVKTVWRNKGIARALTPISPKVVTHLSGLGKTLLIKFPNIIFNPWAIA